MIANLTKGTPVTFDINGTVLLDLGFTSRTYTLVFKFWTLDFDPAPLKERYGCPPKTTNWMLINPLVFKDKAIFSVYCTTVLISVSDKVWVGYIAKESPLCTPALSTCSIIPGITTVSPSHTASTSTSLPSKYLSINISLPDATSIALFNNLVSSSSFWTISIPLPPKT